MPPGWGDVPDSEFLQVPYVADSHSDRSGTEQEESEMAVDVKAAFEELIRKILGDREAAAAYVADPEGTLVEAGVTGGDLSSADIRAVVEEVCNDLDLSPEVRSSLQSYSNPSPSTTAGAAAPAAPAGAPTPPPPVAPPAQPPLEMVQQHLNYVTYVTYEGDETITQEITNIDQSTDINIDVGDYNDGEIIVDIDNVSATDGGVAAGEGASVEDVITGDGNVQVDGNVTDSAVNTGENTGNIVGEMDDSSIVSGNEIGGDVVSVGDMDVDDSAIGFGDGDTGNVSDVSGSGDIGQGVGGGITQVGTDDTAAAQGGGDAFGDIDDSAVSTGGGETTNVSDIDDGSAVSLGDGDAEGTNIEDSTILDVDLDLGRGGGGGDALTRSVAETTGEEALERAGNGLDRSSDSLTNGGMVDAKPDVIEEVPEPMDDMSDMDDMGDM